jgi:hypothetical protein
LIQAVGAEVCPDRAVIVTVKDAFVEAFEHFFFARKIGLRFVINWVLPGAKIWCIFLTVWWSCPKEK